MNPGTSMPLSLNDRNELACRQTAELYRLMPASTAFSYVGASLTFLMLASTGDLQRGAYWFAFASSIMLFRVLAMMEYRHHTNDRGNSPTTWKWLAIFMNFLAGVKWGLLGTVLFVEAPLYRVMFTAIVIVGYVGGSIVSYAPVRFAHAALALPATLPPTIYLFFFGGEANLIAGVAALFMVVALIVTAEAQYRLVRARLLFEIENDVRVRAAEAENNTLGVDLRKLEHRAEVIRRSQIEARRRADTLSHHMQNTLLPVIECDERGRIVEWNDAAVAAFGYQLRDLSELGLDKLVVTPTGKKAWADAFASALEGKVPTAIEVSVLKIGGARAAATFYVTPIDIDGTKSCRAAIIATLKPIQLAELNLRPKSAKG